jgi:YfiR/HmsC-like
LDLALQKSGYNNLSNMFKNLLFVILFCAFAGTVTAQTEEQEANLKAVFLYNFTKYIEWETGNNTNEFIIGIIGSSAVTESLFEIARTNTAKNKKIVVRIFRRPEEIGNCQVLFIAEKTPFSLPAILERSGKGILTVSEKAGFARQGTAFNFVIVNDKLKFEANLKAIYSADLKASSQLLKLAIIVD